jgi:hypothetical protein
VHPGVLELHHRIVLCRDVGHLLQDGNAFVVFSIKPSHCDWVRSVPMTTSLPPYRSKGWYGSSSRIDTDLRRAYYS